MSNLEIKGLKVAGNSDYNYIHVGDVYKYWDSLAVIEEEIQEIVVILKDETTNPSKVLQVSKIDELVLYKEDLLTVGFRLKGDLSVYLEFLKGDVVVYSTSEEKRIETLKAILEYR